MISYLIYRFNKIRLNNKKIIISYSSFLENQNREEDAHNLS